MDFVHLRAYSGHTLMQSLLSPEKLVRAASKMNMPAVAVTDDSNLCAIVQMVKARKAVGAEIAKAEEKGKETKLVSVPRTVFGMSLWMLDDIGAIDPELPDTGWGIALLAKDDTGHRNLCRLATIAQLHIHYRPRIDWDTLDAHRDGLICLTMDRSGPLSGEDDQAAMQRADHLLAIFGHDHLYAELCDQGLPGQRTVLDRTRRWSKDRRVDTVVTSPPRYLYPHGAVGLELLRANGHKLNLDHLRLKGKSLDTDQLWFKGRSDLEKLFPEDTEAINRTLEVAQRCTYMPPTGTFHFPQSDPPPEIHGTNSRWRWIHDWFPPPAAYGDIPRPDAPIERRDGWSLTDEYFAWYARTGLAIRLAKANSDGRELDKEVYEERLESEIRMIHDMGFCAYMLIVAEFINWAKDRGIPVGPGRGSVAGSLVAWAMRVTDVDSIEFDLLFERFLNPARKSMPDVDVDFGQARREEVIDHVKQRYGDDKVAQIITYGTSKVLGSVKDAARGIGMFFNDANKLTNLVGEAKTLEDAMRNEEDLRLMYQHDPVVRRAFDLARMLKGGVRQWGIHAAGVVVTPNPMSDYAPVHHMAEGQGKKKKTYKNVVGVDMKAVDYLGLIKFDFLGLKTLDILLQAIDLVWEATGERPDLSSLPYDDPATLELLGRGDTHGLFQVESYGMQDLLRRLKPSSIHDVIATLALYRPGPLQSGMVDDFVERKHGREDVAYFHPLLEPVLERSYGVIVYQEQVMQSAQVLAGYSLGDADLLRRAMGKKIPEEMEAHRGRFVRGASEKDIETKQANHIFDMIDHFSGYGFNLAHSAAYGLITWQTAWMKAHHRAQLMAAAMTWEANSREKLLAYLCNCRQNGLEVLGPDINKSRGSFHVEDEKIRFGLTAIKKVGQRTVDVIERIRREGGPFESVEDFLQRTTRRAVPKGAFDNLCRAGAFDSLQPRRDLSILTIPPTKKGTSKNHEEAKAAKEASTPWTWSERMDREMVALGIWLTGHPLDQYDATLRSTACDRTIEQMVTAKARKSFRTMGIISKIHKITTKGGQEMVFITISSPSAIVEVSCFPVTTRRYSHLIKKGAAVIVKGALDKDGAEGKFLVEEIRSLDEHRRKMSRSAEIVLENDELAGREAELIAILDRHKTTRRHEDRQTVTLTVTFDKGRKVHFDLDLDLDLCPELFIDMERFTGRLNAVVAG
jgi:DNA polymerase III subunit alpha